MKIPFSFLTETNTARLGIKIRQISNNELRIRGIYNAEDWYEANSFDVMLAIETALLHTVYCIYESANNQLLQ